MATLDSKLIRRRLELCGRVQGVGFRPFVYRLARHLHLTGFVANTRRGAVIEAQASGPALNDFQARLLNDLPPLAHVASLTQRELTPRDEARFDIAASDDPRAASAPRESEFGATGNERPVSAAGGVSAADVTPDAAVCADCVRELFDPHDRRYRYAFINCTNCGPRYSIVAATPYDRPNTSMASFEMCAACRQEYEDPADRRFHAQPIACPACGPQLRLLDGRGTPIARDAIGAAADLLRDGAIVGLKGIGGYHLACRADNERVVDRLRAAKQRDAKPFALMVPDLAAAQALAVTSAADERALASPAAPIVLIRRRPDAAIANAVAGDGRDFGLMLPYSPLHHLLLSELRTALVMTSANLADEPLIFEDEAVLRELCGVVDAFVVHDRAILRPLDDSVVFTFRGDAIPIRRARGYVPSRLDYPAIGAPFTGSTDETTVRVERAAAETTVLAVGAELKATVCVAGECGAIVGEHLGDLSTPAVYRRFVAATERLQRLFRASPTVVAHDLHPQMLSTQFAERSGLPCVAVQHHHAHVAAVMAEWNEPGPVIGVACDGVGFGDDGAVWGGELLRCERGDAARMGHLDYFALPGGDAAARETWRPAAGLLRLALGTHWQSHLHASAPETWERLRDAAYGELDAVDLQMTRGINAPVTSSLGRVFDAVAFLLGVCEHNRHEAEAAMALEALAAGAPDDVAPFDYDVRPSAEGVSLALGPCIRDLLDSHAAGGARRRLAARFHETVARLFACGAALAARRAGLAVAALCGGCFANRRLLERITALLEGRGLRVICPRAMPPGDGAVALGQASVALWRARDTCPRAPVQPETGAAPCV
ncbi:MAG: carbamoyltransferase HypF [Phycisphaerae bacterium]